MAAPTATRLLANQVVNSLRQRRPDSASIILDDVAPACESFSAAQLLYRARRIGACLRAGGCQPGDTVLLFSELRPDAVCILLAGLLTGIRVAVLEHTADLRELKHALHDARPAFMLVSELTSGLADAIDSRQWPCLRKTLVMGDEFLGRTKLGSFNVFVRNARVSDAVDDRLLVADGAPTTALVLFSCDAIGRFKADAIGAGALLDGLQQQQQQHPSLAERPLLRFSDVGATLAADVVLEIVRRLVGVSCVGAKL